MMEATGVFLLQLPHELLAFLLSMLPIWFAGLLLSSDLRCHQLVSFSNQPFPFGRWIGAGRFSRQDR